MITMWFRKKKKETTKTKYIKVIFYICQGRLTNIHYFICDPIKANSPKVLPQIYCTCHDAQKQENLPITLKHFQLTQYMYHLKPIIEKEYSLKILFQFGLEPATGNI